MITNVVKLNEFTKDQKEFANENHYLVDNFLKYRHLSKDKYYDVVIFGYLRAVKKYFIRRELQMYNFSTIALYAMKCDLNNNKIRQQSKKRKAFVVSFDNSMYENNELTISETIAAPGSVTDNMDAEMIWDEIASKLSDNHTEVLRMRVIGYNDREIAKNQGITTKDINNIMEQIRDVVGSMPQYIGRF